MYVHAHGEEKQKAKLRGPEKIGWQGFAESATHKLKLDGSGMVVHSMCDKGGGKEGVRNK